MLTQKHFEEFARREANILFNTVFLIFDEPGHKSISNLSTLTREQTINHLIMVTAEKIAVVRRLSDNRRFDLDAMWASLDTYVVSDYHQYDEHLSWLLATATDIIPFEELSAAKANALEAKVLTRHIIDEAIKAVSA